MFNRKHDYERDPIFETEFTRGERGQGRQGLENETLDAKIFYNRFVKSEVNGREKVKKNY